MDELLARMLESRQVTTAEGRALPLRANLPALECEVLAQWLAELRPRRLLEIGLAYGVSALVIGEAIRHREIGCYHVIDPHQSSEWHDVGLANLRRAGLIDRVTFHREPSELCLPDLLRANVSLDFAFVDGWHAYDHVLVELFYINRMLAPGGLVVLDDVQLASIRLACRHLESLGCYAPVGVPAPIRARTAVKVRRMMNVPEARIVAYRKLFEDTRSLDWAPAEAPCAG